MFSKKIMSFQSDVIKAKEKEGYTVIKHIRLNKNGFPDLQCIKLGCVDEWIECKKDGDTLKELQKFRIDQLISLGKIAYCLHEKKGKIYPL